MVDDVRVNGVVLPGSRADEGRDRYVVDLSAVVTVDGRRVAATYYRVRATEDRVQVDRIEHGIVVDSSRLPLFLAEDLGKSITRTATSALKALIEAAPIVRGGSC